MGWFDDLLSTVRGWFRPAPSGGALDVMRELKAEKRHADPQWNALRNRLKVLVLSEGDQQRLWVRAHRGAGSARLLSGIVAPTPDEIARLESLIRELEAGR